MDPVPSSQLTEIPMNQLENPYKAFWVISIHTLDYKLFPEFSEQKLN